MKDLQHLTMLFHVRIDTKERARNLKIITDYYKQHCVNYECIFIEDNITQDVPDIIELQENYTYIFKKNNAAWNKCASFNRGIALAKSEILAFHDLDAILNIDQIINTIEILKSDNTLGLVYPYNGNFLCVDTSLKDKFEKTLDIACLYEHFPKQVYVNYSNSNVLVGAINSVGGCVLGRRDNVIKAGGYNPNFKGWGYEDNEFPNRVHKLGFGVTRLSGKQQVLWHLPHDGEGASPKADNPHYQENNKICQFIETQTKEKIQAYIEGWSVV